ncbi:hypothetical protein PL8927_790085 [Planktothrix serta PCC 8927]|uniref:Uncharacterized protein n=1 Tax=Planktothrix serta PCC 8927 TaxID=671068 RepID=A0A7Z9E460_9CYAN|nr:hypothetical protein PL8927_790085 [Planktothrix serta PCC 8927]
MGYNQVEISYNPYQGLKRKGDISHAISISVEISYNPYQGLKLSFSRPTPSITKDC